MSDFATFEERSAAMKRMNSQTITKADIQKIRGSSTIEEVLVEFDKIGKCLNDVGVKGIDKRNLGKACFVLCNTYTKPSYKLGVGPLNDALTVANNHYQMGYSIYYLHNPRKQLFLDCLKIFLKFTKQNLTIFYTGHGASIPDKSGDESDGFDEVLVFDVGYIVDDLLLKTLVENTNPKSRVLLLSDCCHSGSIWDIQSARAKSVKLSPNIVSISAAKDSQTAKQTTIGQKSQGIFTYYFWSIVNSDPHITIKDMEAKINGSLKRFNQHYTYACSAPGLENQPIFE
ncbi:Clan CD, family C14, metacaspase-like cysteine peptidase [Tritrichomonas foetus]|uniref:Clan CD, family C14, metacaspase-like cysteine peptidase n=1 Tax=Tritrichomonas foetus TaxID=1144522 RepID=A0A1J4JHV5_9EUKA|nr:Clan CD, family C14, metacaspase-like cysteine peptidase [Tritrichomonas foetus]|eukprot:OHS98305.1 Clan CD, family C14, metacaspase-like cysteine peptidase [Tritrichomonas foetus]